MSQTTIVLLLSLLLGLQPVTTDLYLPGLPALSGEFGSGMDRAHLTLSAMLLAFGLSQLVWGPLSDRYGRRPVLLWGVSGYVAAAVACAFATSMEMLILGRIAQGAAMGAGVMSARAVVRDLYAPTMGARVMSKGLSGLGVAACISAPLGSVVAELLGWRATLLATGVFGAVALALVALRYEESLPARNPRALQPATLLRTWGRILRHPTFGTWAGLAASSYAGLFTFLATSSFVFIQVLGVSRPVYGLLMMSMSTAYLAGTVLCRRLLPRFGVRRTVALAGGLSLVGGSLMGGLALAGVQSVWAIMLPLYLFMLGHGVHQPCGQSGAVGPFPQAAGAASALSGFLMMVVSFAMGQWLGSHAQGSVALLTNGIWFWGVVSAALAWTLVQRHGEPAAT